MKKCRTIPLRFPLSTDYISLFEISADDQIFVFILTTFYIYSPYAIISSPGQRLNYSSIFFSVFALYSFIFFYYFFLLILPYVFCYLVFLESFFHQLFFLFFLPSFHFFHISFTPFCSFFYILFFFLRTQRFGFLFYYVLLFFVFLCYWFSFICTLPSLFLCNVFLSFF